MRTDSHYYQARNGYRIAAASQHGGRGYLAPAPADSLRCAAARAARLMIEYAQANSWKGDLMPSALELDPAHSGI